MYRLREYQIVICWFLSKTNCPQWQTYQHFQKYFWLLIPYQSVQPISMWWQTLALCSCQTWHLWDVELTSRALCGPSSFCWDAVFVRVCTFDCAFCVERCASVLLCVLHSACRRLCFCARCVRRLAKSQALPIQVQGQVFFSSDSGDKRKNISLFCCMSLSNLNSFWCPIS